MLVGIVLVIAAIGDLITCDLEERLLLFRDVRSSGTQSVRDRLTPAPRYGISWIFQEDFRSATTKTTPEKPPYRIHCAHATTLPDLRSVESHEVLL